MFRLVRTLILLMFAFVAGMLFERNDNRETCLNANGTWTENVCIESELEND